MNIVIENAFRALIPPLSPDERAQLEANILADGCREPLVVWGGVLIDGHNRYEICTKHGLPFKTVEKDFSSKAEARIWMRSNQKGRRNLTPAWVIELELGNKEDLLALGKQKRIESKVGNDNAAKTSLSQNDKVVLQEPVPQAAIREQKPTVQAQQQPPVAQAPRPAVHATKPVTPAPKPADPVPKHNTQKDIAKAAGVSTGQIGMAEQVRKKAPELWEKAKQGEVSISSAYTQVRRAEKEEKREARREENRAKIAEVVEPSKVIEAGARFATIMIDPPWDWGDEGDKDQLGRARPDYSTMSIGQLMGLPVSSLADDDCHIYMWITNRSLPKGFQLLDKWGFRYVTAITWVKPHFGMGNYFRGQTEHVLFGVRGSQPLKRKDASTVYMADRGKGGHSSKPMSFYEFVESCSPGPYLEMFSRNDRDGWTVWGEASHECA